MNKNNPATNQTIQNKINAITAFLIKKIGHPNGCPTRNYNITN